MSLNINLYMWFSAIFPIVLLLILIIIFKINIVKSAIVALIITLITSKFIYKANILLIWNEILKGAWSSLNVISVIWTAIFLSEVVNKANIFEVFKSELHTIIPNETLQILTIAWVFPSFLQGITGFGVPVAICAPLLVGLGINPISAVVMTLLGQAWGSTFGTLALAWNAMVDQTSLSTSYTNLMETAFYSAILIWVWNLISGAMILIIYKKKNIKTKEIITVLFISFIHGIGQLYFIRISTTLACFIPSVIAIVGILLLGKLSWYKDEDNSYDKQSIKKLNKAFFTYYLLTALILIVLLVSPIKDFLEGVSLSLSFPRTETGYKFVNESVANYSPVYIFTHASLFLFISGLFGYFYYRKINWIESPEMKSILNYVVKKSTPSTLAVLSFIVISKLMLGSGQIYVLSQGISIAVKRAYIFISPFIGLLGTFITSSNLASNILFGNFQETTAITLKLSSSLVLAAQTAGGAIGAVISPGNVVLGATTTNTLGKEDEILKKLIPIALLSTMLIGIIVTIIDII